MKKFLLFIVSGILFSSTLISQEKEETPFNELPAVRISSMKVSRQAGTSNIVSVIVIVRNLADAITPGFEFRLTADNEVIGKQQITIAPQTTDTLIFKWEPSKTAEYHLKAVADPDERLHESDRSDNISELVVSTAPGRLELIDIGPRDSTLSDNLDLVAENISVVGHRYEARKVRMVTVNFRVRNSSKRATNKPFRTLITIQPETGDAKSFYVQSGVLTGGQSSWISHTIQNAPARFNITIICDPDKAIAERDRQNNTITSFYKNPAPPVDRWISAGPDHITGVNNIGYPWASAVGRLSVMAIDRTSTQVMYVGGQSCGIWKTTDGGSNWFPLTDQISVSVAAIALAPQNANQLFWATARQGVFRSDDAGTSWVRLSMQDLNAIVHGGKLLIHPRDGNVMFVKSDDGIYRSADGGITWTGVLSGAKGTGLEIDVAGDVLYAALSSETNNMLAGIYRSYDRGITWRKLAGCPDGSLPATNNGKKITIAVFGSRLYAGFKSSTEFQLYRPSGFACSIGGVQETSWEKAWKTTTNQQEIWSELWANPLDENSLYLGGTAFWRSTDKGSNFTKVSDYGTPSGSAHADHHGFGVFPGQAKTIFSLNDGGIYRSLENGKSGTWTFLGKGISNVEFYDVADAFTRADLLIGGTQDNGTIKTEGTLAWKAIRGGDGATVDVDNTDAAIMYSMEQYASSIARSTNGGSNWSGLNSGLPTGAVCFNIRYHLHPKNMNILLAACEGLKRIIMPGGTWQTIFTPPEGNVTASAVESGSDVYLASTTAGKLFAGIGGSNFREVFKHPSGSSISDVEYDPDKSSVIYLGFGGGSRGRVYRLVSKASGNYDSLEITSNLPNGVNVQCIAVDRMNLNTIYIGSSKGVYRGRSFNNGVSWLWSTYMDGLPLADVRDLEVHPVSGVITAATFGRSAFEVSTGDPLGSVLAAEGKINFLRVHDVSTKFGPPNDVLDAEVIVSLDSRPGFYFGLQLRPDAKEPANRGVLRSLRTAFESNLPVRIEYVRNGLRSGVMIRSMLK